MSRKEFTPISVLMFADDETDIDTVRIFDIDPDILQFTIDDALGKERYDFIE